MKKIAILGILCAFFFCAQAQVKQISAPAGKASANEKCEREDCQTMMKLKREFMEKNMQLNDNQKKEFWAAYDEKAEATFNVLNYSRKQKEEAGLSRHIAHDSIQYLNDKQILLYYQLKAEVKEKISIAETKFFKRISLFLTAKQVDQYYQLERKFQHSAVHKANGKKDEPKMKGKEMKMESAPLKGSVAPANKSLNK